MHQQVHVIGLAAQLGEGGVEVLAHLAHHVPAETQHVVIEDVPPILRSEDHMRVEGVHDATSPAHVWVWLPP